MKERKNKLLKDKYTIFLKFYNTTWKPYFHNANEIHCFDYDYAKNLYEKLCKNFNLSQWMLVKVENMYSEDDFIWIKEND